MWPIIVIGLLLGAFSAVPKEQPKTMARPDAMTDKQQELGLYMFMYEANNQK